MPLTTRLLGLLLLVAAFSPALFSSFHFDDHALFQDAAVASGTGWLGVFRLEQTRPLTYLTFWANYQLGGQNPLGYHALNLALHIAVVFFAWSAFRRVTGEQAALAAVVLFALHPVQTEPVAYVFARATLLAALFGVLCWRAWLDGRYASSAAWFALGLLAKEEIIALPAFLAGFDLLWRRIPAAEWKPRFAPLAVMLAFAAAAAARLFYAASVTPGSGFAMDLGEITPARYLMTQGRVLWQYARLLLFPAGLNVDHHVRLAAFWDLQALAAWAVLLALAAAALWRVRRRRELFWFLGGLILIAPTSSFVPLADLMAERRLYLPLLSLSLGAGLLLARLPRYALLILALVLAGLSFQRSLVWRTEESLWRDAVQKSPQKARPKLQLARALGERNEPERAEQFRLLQQARALDPDNPEIAAGIGVFHLQTGNAELALEEFERVLQQKPPDAQALVNHGAALYLTGEIRRAEQQFRRALELDPCNFDARNNLALMAAQQGDRARLHRLAEPPARCGFTPEQRQTLANRARR